MVDAPCSCKVCGADLTNLDGDEVCGAVCARILKFSESPVVATIRAKIAGRLYPCSPDCLGWAVFNADSDPELERCDECWGGEDDPLYDEEIEVLPEAQAELRLAGVLRGGYKPPLVSRHPCECGCVVFRANFVVDTNEQCMGCDISRPTLIEDADPSGRLVHVVAKMTQALRQLAAVGKMQPKTIEIENVSVYEALAAEADEALRLAGPEGAVRRYLDVSTGCVSCEDYERIEEGGVESLIARQHPYGCWVWVPDQETDLAALRESIPTLMPVIEFARKRGCSWINFDQDADAVEGLPHFDW